ncbi:MAG TPA: 50S ribosomal protein L15 [bacterium]|nr:50S ribosomal protein L15 [bacterium]
MKLHQLEKPPGSTHAPKRKGRGPGSNLGKTAGRGQKGQKARGTVKPGFEGGQTPLRRRLPRRGFKNPFKAQFHIVNLSDLTKRPALAEKVEVGPADLAAANAIRDIGLPVKVLGTGELTRAVTVHAHKFSRSALEKIQAAGGQAIVIEA